MVKRVVCSVPTLFILMVLIEVGSSQLPPDQVNVMTSVYRIFNDTSSFFMWRDFGINTNPCSWKGVFCSTGNSSINQLSFTRYSISTSQFLPLVCSLSTLESLDVSNNQLTSIPQEFYTDCGQIRGLKLLNFSWNNINGPLPTFNGFRTLESLDISRNKLDGEVKLQLATLGSLKNLNLGWNKLGGIVPTSLGEMNLLEELRLSNNYFTGEIPVQLITKYTNLSVIDLSANNLSGSIPDELELLPRLETLVLSLNNLGGVIPSSLSKITTLKRFAANQNRFFGTIPSGITSYVEALDLSYNQLTGTIPTDLLSGPNLRSLDLTNNRLQGPIPSIKATGLFRLRLGSNSLNSTIQSESWESLGELMYLELDNNSLSGVIPLELGRCRKLALLNLAQNRLTGPLPPELGDLTNLQVLSLQFNNFVGEIPPQISRLNRLEKLNISRNSLNGLIPSSITILKNLTNLDLQANILSGPIPESIDNLSSLIELQLGANQLSGRIPRMPQKLQIALNLSNNLFSGNIPNTLTLMNLEVLDLSSNKFSGEIPEFLTQLSVLTHLLLSNNQLTGKVPVFKSHVTLEASGNNLIFPGPPSQRKRKSVASEIIIGISCAFMTVALLILVGIFISRRYHRIDDIPTQSIEITSPQRVIHGHLLTPNSIHRSNIDFDAAMEAVSDPSNITLNTRFSTYYKAVMPSGSSYFAKKLNWSDKIFQLGSHEKFGEELETLGMLGNSNVMIPLAYVLTVDSAYLFYDFAPSGTVFDALHHRIGNTLDWASRYSIAIGVSQGLAFLHECKSSPILLLDLSSKSIFLKSLNEPQVGDIELCKVIDPSKSTGSLSAVAGSVGYVPPAPTPSQDHHNDLINTIPLEDDENIVEENTPIGGDQNIPTWGDHVPVKENAPIGEDQNQNPTRANSPRRSLRQTRQPTKLKDYLTYSVSYPIQNFLSYSHISKSHHAFLNCINQIEPKNFKEANLHPTWRKAMEEELNALEKNNTWSLVHLPKGKKAVGCKWVYKVKYDSLGKIERYKARLVAKGFTQTYGIDYEETFAPVAKMSTVRILLSIGTNKNWSFHQMDVKNAFLQGDLEEEVYMTLPQGLKNPDSTLVCKLHKSIYGLKQSPRAWYSKLSHALLSQNFRKSSADSSLFTRISSNSSIIVLVYVDDIIITGDKETEIQDIKNFLKQTFDIKDLGILKYFLGIEIAHSTKGLFLSQRKYTLDLLQETGKLGVKPASTPMETSAKLNSEDGSPLQDVGMYQRLVGKLIYLTVTRPDIAFPVSVVSQFMQAPRTTHLAAIDRILQYLKSTPGQGIWIKNNNDVSIQGYTDADWAGSFDRRSTTGFCTMVGGNLVTWKSKKQNVVARSSAEAEYRAMASTASELTWIKPWTNQDISSFLTS